MNALKCRTCYEGDFRLRNFQSIAIRLMAELAAQLARAALGRRDRIIAKIKAWGTKKSFSTPIRAYPPQIHV